MTVADTLALVMSAGALVVSVIALYAQFFRRRAFLQARILHWGLPDNHPDLLQVSVRTGEFEAKYAVVNRGNLQFLLVELSCLLAESEQEMVDGEGIQVESTVEGVPCLVMPGEIRSVTIRTNASTVGKQKWDTQFPYVSLEAVCSTGETYEAIHSIRGSGLPEGLNPGRVVLVGPPVDPPLRKTLPWEKHFRDWQTVDFKRVNGN